MLATTPHTYLPVLRKLQVSKGVHLGCFIIQVKLETALLVLLKPIHWLILIQWLWGQVWQRIVPILQVHDLRPDKWIAQNYMTKILMLWIQDLNSYDKSHHPLFCSHEWQLNYLPLATWGVCQHLPGAPHCEGLHSRTKGENTAISKLLTEKCFN